MSKFSSDKLQEKIDKCNEKYKELIDVRIKISELHESLKDEKGHVVITSKNMGTMNNITAERYNYKIKEELDNCINNLNPYDK